MPDVIINVAPQTTASVEVDVDNVASYYYDLAKQWAISPNLVEQLDYSSKYYANLSSTSATTAQNAADSILNNAGFIAVSADLTNIDTVAGSISNVNAVATDISNVNAVYADLTNIDSVVGDLTNIDSVAGDLTNINAVNSNKTNIDIVASAKTNIDTTATYISNINTVAGSITNVNTVAGDLTNINAVASDLTNIGTVATNITDINTCSTNISDINTCAANISTIADKVSKTGDTMTGDLVINKSVPAFVAKSTVMDKTATTAPVSNIVGGDFLIFDKNNRWVGGIETNHTVNNDFTTHLATERDISGTFKTGAIGIGVDSTGNDFAYASGGVKQSITNWSFPQGTYTRIAIGAGFSSYQAPSDGWFCFRGVTTVANGYIYCDNESGLYDICFAGASGMTVSLIVPCSKGMSYKADWGGATPTEFYFVSAIGG